MLAGAHPFESRIRSHGVEGEQSLAKDLAIQDFAGGWTFKVLREIKAQIRLFQDVEQTRHGPRPANLPLEPAQIPGLFLWLQRGKGYPAPAFVENADLLLWERAIKGCLRVFTAIGRRIIGAHNLIIDSAPILMHPYVYYQATSHSRKGPR